MAVPYLQIACFMYGLEPLQTANLNAIQAVGRSDLFFKLEIIKKTISIAILLCFMKFGVMAIALSSLAYSVIATMLNASPNKKLLDYRYLEQIKDIIPSFLVAAVMGAAVYPMIYLPLPNIVIVIIQAILGAAIYIGLSALLRLEPYRYVLSTVKDFRGRYTGR